MTSRLQFAGFLLAGLFLGLAHGARFCTPLAWIGVAGLAVGLREVQSRWVALGGLTAALFTEVLVANPWWPACAAHYWPDRPVLDGVVVLAFAALNALPKALPIAVGWLALRRWPIPLWLPAAWIVGEGLRNGLTRQAYCDWLYTQWQHEYVLRLAGHWGWIGANLLCLTLAAALGEALLRRSPRWTGFAVILTGVLMVQPAITPVEATFWPKVGALHLNGYAHLPKQAPAGVAILVWPEGANYQRPHVEEGPGHGKRIEPPLPPQGVAHLMGLITRTDGGHQNAIVALSPDGTVQMARAKVRLFPLTERPVWGWSVYFAQFLVPGAAAATLPTPVGPALSLICQEALERDFVLDQARIGATWLSQSNNEKVLVDSPHAFRQFLATSAFLAVETGLPVVRSAIYGLAALVDRDGTVLAVSEPDTDGVLTLASDVLSHAGPP